MASKEETISCLGEKSAALELKCIDLFSPIPEKNFLFGLLKWMEKMNPGIPEFKRLLKIEFKSESKP